MVASSQVYPGGAVRAVPPGWPVGRCGQSGDRAALWSWWAVAGSLRRGPPSGLSHVRWGAGRAAASCREAGSSRGWSHPGGCATLAGAALQVAVMPSPCSWCSHCARETISDLWPEISADDRVSSQWSGRQCGMVKNELNEGVCSALTCINALWQISVNNDLTAPRGDFLVVCESIGPQRWIRIVIAG